MNKILLIVVSLLVLPLLMTSYMYGHGTASDTVITNAQDKGTTGDADQPGDSVIQYGNPLDTTFSNNCNNVTKSTVTPGYDMATLWQLSDGTGYANATNTYSYSITNWGNISDTIQIIIVESNHTGTFTGAIYKIVTNGATASGPGASINWTTPSIAADAAYTYTVKVYIPPTAVNPNWNVYQISNQNQAGAGTGDTWPTVYAILPAVEDTANARDTLRMTL